MSTLLAWIIMNRGKGTTHCRRVSIRASGARKFKSCRFKVQKRQTVSSTLSLERELLTEVQVRNTCSSVTLP